MNKNRSTDAYVKFSGYNSIDKQSNNSNNKNIPSIVYPTQVPDDNNRFSDKPPQANPNISLDESENKNSNHRLFEIVSSKLHQLISDPNFQRNPKGPSKIFVKVYTSWCAPCRMITPKIEELSMNPKYSDILFLKIDGTMICDKLKKYINVSAVPVFFTFFGGKQFDDFVVGPDLKKIVERLEKLSSL
jgi:thiol-disulfide isomerase/thioredoxin